MDPNQPQSKPTPQEPAKPLDQSAPPAPEPIAPFSFNDEPQLPSQQPGQIITATNPSPEAKVPDAPGVSGSDNTPVSIPIFDSTADAPAEPAATVNGTDAASTLTNTKAAEPPAPEVQPLAPESTPETVAAASTTEDIAKNVTEEVAPTAPISSAPQPSLPSAAETPVPPADSTPPLPPVPGPLASGGGTGAGPKPSHGHKWIVILMVAILLLAAGTAAAMMALKEKDTKEASDAPVKVGFLMALTGGSSSMGYGTNKGIQLAKKQLAADNLEIVQADSKCDPKVAAEAIKRLIAQKVVAIIGDGCSSGSTAALPAANNAKIPMISPSASSPSLTTPNDYFFRVIPNDNFQGAFMAQSIFDKGLRNVAVFYTNESYGSSMSKVFKEKFESLGGKVSTSVSAESDVIELTTQMNTLKAAKPDAIFFSPNSVVSATAAIKVARQVGITAPFFGADAFYDTTIIKDAGTAADGLTITSFPTGSKSFKQALLNEYQVTEQLYGASQAYDAFRAIHMAVKKGATTGEQVAQLLPTITFDGVSARIAFDENGEISDKAYKYDLLQVKNGAFSTIE